MPFSPSDLQALLACPHLFALEQDRRAAHGLRPARSAEAELLARKGETHERAQLERFRDSGRSIVEVGLGDGYDWSDAAARTRAAVHHGVDVVYQGVFDDWRWRGVADFLVRVEQPSALGPWSYEAWDTKLARRARPYFLLQLCFYTSQLAALQGRQPEWMRIVLGSGDIDSYRFDDFAAYARRLWLRVEQTAASGETTYPYPVRHCQICDYGPSCEEQWERDDHPSRIAGIRHDQVEKLNAAGIATVAALAACAAPPAATIGRVTLERLRQQARLQDHQRRTGAHAFELLPPERGRGFALLPGPDPGDLFFDMEGYPYFEPAGGIEYLFGIVDDASRFRAFRAADRQGEKAAFEAFVDVVTERVARFPASHVYHYAQYEPSALKRLAMQHATREAELDQLLRRETFVDLYQVVRHTVRISYPSYSIKDVRRFFMPEAGRGEITGGTQSIAEFERWLETGDPHILEAIERYNEEDCDSTWRLRDWLLERRAEAERRFGAIAWPEIGTLPEEEGDAATFGDDERDALLEASAAASIENRAALATLAHVVTYHRREAKPAWWAYFARRRKAFDELLADTEAIAGIEPGGAPREEGRSLVYPCRFEEQECKLTADSPVEDPTDGTGSWSIVSIDAAEGRIELKRGKGSAHLPLPGALIAGGPVPTKAQRAALVELARDVLRRGLDAGRLFQAARDMLLRRPPAVAGRPRGARIQATDLDGQRRLVTSLDDSYLFVQGPPGSGKTWAGARFVVALLRGGRRVGITGPSHKAIHNLLDEIERVAVEEGVRFAGLKKASGSMESEYVGRFITSTRSNADCESGDPAIQLIAGTPWLFARDGMRQSVHTLFADESGQLSLADALAVSLAARNVVLLGDPQQLAHVSQGVHPMNSGRSVLAHLLDGAATVSETRGLFLDRTWRMHGDVCRFVSQMSYDSRLEPAADCERQQVRSAAGLSGTGLRFMAVNHSGNAQRSEEEAERIAAEIRTLLSSGTFVDLHGTSRPIVPSDILVVAPFNLQVHCLRHAVPAGVEVGTVDKFQGREAAVVFFSMACSSGDDVPRGLGFLFSRNRLNVALSRARALAVIVASPTLLASDCATIGDMRLVNLLCRFAEEAAGS